MRTYIENIRDEIFAQYEKCFYGREQMESFVPLYSSTYARICRDGARTNLSVLFSAAEFTEELLDEHEKELEEINLYYLHNEQLFANLANWHEVWAEYREFQVSRRTRSRLDRHPCVCDLSSSVKRAIPIDSNVEATQLCKRRSNASISNSP